MANQKVTKAREQIAKVYEQLKAGQDVQEACAQLMAYFQNAQELTEKGQRKNTLFEFVGDKTKPVAQMQWLQSVLEMPEDAFEISYLDRKGAEKPTTLRGADIAERIRTIQGVNNNTLGGELHAINVAMSGKINSHIITSASKELSNEDAFVLSLTEAVTTGKSQEEISKIVEEAQAKNVDVQSVIDGFTEKYADKIKGLLSGVVVKTPDKQNVPKPKFSIRETVSSIWRRIFPKKERESTKDDKAEGIEISDNLMNDIAQYISMTKVLDSTESSLESFVRAKLVASEYNVTLKNPEEPDKELDFSSENYGDLIGVGEDGKRDPKTEQLYEQAIKAHMQKVRDSLGIEAGNKTWEAIAKFIDKKGAISELSEEEKKLLSASKILKPLTRKIDAARGKLDSSIETILDGIQKDFTVPENEGDGDQPIVPEENNQPKISLKDKIKEAKDKFKGFLTGLISKEEVKDENGLKEPAKKEKDKEEKQGQQEGQKPEKKGKVKKLPKNNEFTAFEPEKDEFAKNIETYIKLYHSDKPNLVEYLKTASYKENSTLSGLMVSLRSASEPYFKKYKDENQNSTAPTVFGKFTLIDGYLESINLECMSIEGLKKYPSKVKSKKQKALTKEEAKVQAEAKFTQYTALIENVRKFINDPKASKADPDLRRKTLLILNETLRKNGFEDKNISVVEKVEKLEALGLEVNMNEMQVLECITDFAHSPRALTKDKKERDMYKDLIEGSKKFFAENGSTQDLSSVRVLSDEEFLQMCADTLVARAVAISMTEKEKDGHDSLNAVVEKSYRSLKRNNKSLLKDSIKHASEVIRNCGKYSSANIEVLSNATLPKDSPLAAVVKEGFSFDKLPADMIAKIEGMVNDQIQNLGILEVSQELVDDMFKDTFGPEKANETEEPITETEENATVVDLANIQSEFDGFIANDKSRQNVVADYAAVYSLDKQLNGILTAMDPKIGYEVFLDNEASEEQKIEKVKAVLGDTIRESVGDDQKAFETAIKEIADFGTKYFTAKKAMEVQINEFNDSLPDDKKLADPMSFADKYTRAQAIKSLQEKEDRDLEDEELLTSLENEHKAELKKQQESGKTPLSEVEEKFISNTAEPVKDDDENAFKPVQVDSNYSETFKDVYAEWKDLKDKKNPSNEEKERLKKLVQENVNVIVSKMIAEGAKIPDDASKKTAEEAIKSKEVLTDEERDFIGANSNLVDTIKLSTTHYDNFCKAVIAQNGVKQIPHLSATREVDEKGNIKYAYSVTVIKTYEQMYPNTDMSQTIQKSVKDLKDAYVYLKPGIKLCDKLLDYIKTLKFAEVHNKMQTLGKDNGGSGSGNGSDNDKDKDKDPQNTNENDKIVALLKEINEKLEQFKKQVDLAVAKVGSAKPEATKLGAEVSMKIFDASNLLTNLAKSGMDPALLTKYNEENKIYFDEYNKYNKMLLELGPLQFPVQNMGDGTFALWGPYLASMAMMNPAYIAPLAGFLNQDPTQFGKVFMQMRPMHLVNVTVTQEVNGAPFTFKVDINLADAYSEDKVAMLKQNINEHIKEFMSSGITKVEVIKADLMAYIDRIAMGSQVGSASLENILTKEKQVLQSNDGNEPEEEKDDKKVEPTVKSSTPVKKEGTKEHAPKPRFDFVIKDKTITITENGKEVISKVIDKALTPAEEAYIRGELNEIQRAEFKNAEEEQFFFNAMFDKLLEGTKTKNQQQNPAQEQGLEGGM